ncbi:hypothetical protein GCM10025331_11140 [Actinoplanes utahensis]|nr:hypothetical protein Aut01nite_18380 [Actinoplanes utahensis]
MPPPQMVQRLLKRPPPEHPLHTYGYPDVADAAPRLQLMQQPLRLLLRRDRDFLRQQGLIHLAAVSRLTADLWNA